MYRQLNHGSKYTHTDAVMAFNVAADVLGISHVYMRDNDYNYDEEDEEEEGNIKEVVPNNPDDIQPVENAPDE
jgi:hypothetical protein